MSTARSDGRARAVLALAILLGLALVCLPFFLTPPAYLELALRDNVFGSDLNEQRVVVTDDATGKRLTAAVEKIGGAFVARIGRINSGKTSYTARLDGYKPGAAHVDAAALQTVRAPVDLTPIFGRVEISPVNATKIDEPVMATMREGDKPLATEPQRVISVSLPAGRHRLAAQASGFCPADREVDVRQGVLTKVVFPLSPDLKDDEIARFVLGWSAEPRDLDSHFRRAGTSGYPNPEHVFFAHPQGTTGTVLFARLDVDQLFPGRYETITVRSSAVGDFDYFVHLYAGLGTIGSSGATVQVYTRGCEVKTYTVPRDCAQRIWAVTKLHYDGQRVQLTDQQRCDPAEMSPVGVNLKAAVQQLIRAPMNAVRR